ncbi:MAG: class II aldolase/adducin family protein [Candidatus Aminicenantes bacterium]|nr:class II aldolase/adducin family protein [Candidatus Aminicenantes bacterium]
MASQNRISQAKIIQKIKAVGQAMLALGLQNTHSGNISARWGKDFFITKTGSMKGHLEDRDIILVGTDEPRSGLFQASSETGTHQKILSFSGAALHAHSLASVLISYRHTSLRPLDALGKLYLKEIPVIEFEYPVGSPEMERDIPLCLQNHPAMIVKTHGPFTHGRTLEEAFFRLTVLDYSAQILFWLELLGTPLEKLTELNYPSLPEYETPSGKLATQDEELINQFRRTALDVFYLELSPFHTGSLSVRNGQEMLYSPQLSTPHGFLADQEIKRICLEPKSDDYFIQLHQAVYRYSSAKAAIFTHSPWGMIQALHQWSQGQDRVIPADAEGSYFYPAIGLSSPSAELTQIVELATRYKMVILPGLGVLAIGHTPGYVIHHVSSLKNICFLLTHLKVMQGQGLVKNMGEFLNKKGRDW